MLIKLSNGDLTQYLILTKPEFESSKKIAGTDLYVAFKARIKSGGCQEQEIACKLNVVQFDSANLNSHYQSSKIGPIIMSIPNSGDLMLLKHDLNNSVSAFLFRNILASHKNQKLLSVTALDESSVLFHGIIQTTECVYLVHPNQKKRDNELCSIEIKGKPEWCEMVSKKCFIICKRGVIEMYKYKCLNNSHELKLIFAVNSFSQKITCIFRLGK